MFESSRSGDCSFLYFPSSLTRKAENLQHPENLRCKLYIIHYSPLGYLSGSSSHPFASLFFFYCFRGTKQENGFIPTIQVLHHSPLVLLKFFFGINHISVTCNCELKTLKINNENKSRQEQKLCSFSMNRDKKDSFLGMSLEKIANASHKSCVF